MEVDTLVCDICLQELTKLPFNKERIAIVQHLFNTSDFHAHEGCINEVVKKAFYPYFSERLAKSANKA